VEAPGVVLTPEPDPLARRFLNVRTLASFLLGFAMLAVLLPRMNVELGGILARVTQANVGLYLAALVFYYLTFPIRAYRWRKLLRNVGFLPDEGVRLPGIPGITQIILLSWFANCIVPAKLGDMYRAYLLKQRAGVSFSKTFGTILAERIIDTLMLFSLLAFSTLFVFGSSLPPQVLSILQVGVVLVVLVVLALLSMRGMSHLITPLVPSRFRSHYTLFEEGTLGAFGRGRMPMILAYTVLCWAIEAGRVYLVCLALGVSGLGLPVVLFIALSAALLTTLPITPAGLGFVESAVVGILVLTSQAGLVSGVDQNLAGAIAILDRSISYWSVIVLGMVIYFVSKRR
jgi:glycosyltransferase 2 family protein